MATTPEARAVAMFREAMADCAYDKLLKAKLVGSPEIVDQNSLMTNLRVNVELQADPAAFRAFSNRLRQVFEKISIAKTEFNTKPDVRPNDHGYFPFHIPKGALLDSAALYQERETFTRKGPVVWLMTGGAPPHARGMHWSLYQLPEPCETVFEEVARRSFALRFRFLKSDGSTAIENECRLNGAFAKDFDRNGVGFLAYDVLVTPRRYIVGPIFRDRVTWHHCRWTFHLAHPVNALSEDLRQVTKCAVTIEPLGGAPADTMVAGTPIAEDSGNRTPALVRVIGAGENPETALQDAFSQAVQQAVPPRSLCPATGSTMRRPRATNLPKAGSTGEKTTACGAVKSRFTSSKSAWTAAVCGSLPAASGAISTRPMRPTAMLCSCRNAAARRSSATNTTRTRRVATCT